MRTLAPGAVLQDLFGKLADPNLNIRWEHRLWGRVGEEGMYKELTNVFEHASPLQTLGANCRNFAW